MGVWSNVEEATRLVSAETKNEPIKENAEVYDRLFPIYQDLYGALKDSLDRISEIYS